MTHRFTVMYPLPGGKEEERIAYVCLPDSYFQRKTKRFPVIYMFDGHNVFFDEDATFGTSWGMDDFMENNQPQVIIAAIECNHNPNNGRMEEYSPYTFYDPKYGRVYGRGQETMDWIVHEFKPYIDHHYRTLPDRQHTFIAGSSMGGLMTIYALTHYNHIFSRGAALSPAVSFSISTVEQMIKAGNVGENSILYMDYGEKEFESRPQALGHYNRVATALMEKGVLLNSRVVPEGEHTEASWEKQIPIFLETLFYNL